MRILVVSDTHGDEYGLCQTILAQPKAEVVIHLGDGQQDLELQKARFPEKMFLQVRGNCDWGSSLPVMDERVFEGVRVFFTHGHIYRVKYGTYEFESAARDHKANVALYGHTHMPETCYRDGLYMMNPGSLHGSCGTYGIIDITPQGIVTNIIDRK
ncbi:MAG TPA: YfcE family phosphodiesterase [Firmicutes bacterium]|nr:YfcE family phosphodiesterase [Bacillota bacterium]